MDDSDNSYAPSQSFNSPGSPTHPPTTKPAVTAPTTSAPTTRAASMSSTRPKRSLPAPSADSSEDDRSFDFPVPRPQTIPSVDEVAEDPTLRSLWNFHDLHDSLDNNLDNILQESPLTPDHFNESSVLHTLFFIKKVATIQCDSCEGKGRGDETYKCAQCVKQICRQCMEHMLDREAAAPENEKEASKWNWQGQYRHEGLKRCYISRKAAQSNDSHHIKIPVSLLGIDSSDEVTIHMVKGNNIDDTSPKITKDPRDEREVIHPSPKISNGPRREPEVIDLTGDLPEPTTTNKPRSAPKVSAHKSAVGSARPRFGTQQNPTIQRTRFELSPNVSRALDRIESAAAAANQRGRLSLSPDDPTLNQTAFMAPNSRSQVPNDQSQRRSQRRRPQQHGQPHTPAAPQFTQPATYSHAYNMQQSQLAAYATTYQTLPAGQLPGNSYQQFGNHVSPAAQLPRGTRGPARRAIFAPPPGSFLLIPNPNKPSGCETVSWEQYQDFMNRSQKAASSGLNIEAQAQSSTTSGSAARTAQVPRHVNEEDPRNTFFRDNDAGAALDAKLDPVQTLQSGERPVAPMPLTSDPTEPHGPVVFSRGAAAATTAPVQLSPGAQGLNHFRHRNPADQRGEAKLEDDDQPMADADTPIRTPYPPPVAAPRRESPPLETINDVLRALSPSPPPAMPSAPAAAAAATTEVVDVMPSGPISGGRQGQRGEDEGRLEEVQAQARMRAALALVPEARELGLQGGEVEKGDVEDGEGGEAE